MPIILVFLLSLTGCIESTFQLSSESRLPKWFVVPDGVDRSQLSVKMELYSTFSGGKDIFTLYEKGKFFPVEKFTVTSDMQYIGSVQLKSPPEGFPKGYPRYKVLTINDITDIIELRKMEPFFYMTDDPAIWKELGVEQK
jgi:hypothetical protein